MKAKGNQKGTLAMLGLPDQIIAAQDRTVPMEQWMDRRYPGTWVRDDSCDRFVAIDPEHTGPGIGYLVYDRRYRSATTVVHQHQIN